MGSYVLELLKSDFLGLIGNCLKGRAPKHFAYASRHAVRQITNNLSAIPHRGAEYRASDHAVNFTREWSSLLSVDPDKNWRTLA